MGLPLKHLAKWLTIATLSVLAGCASQYSISEREIENHLNKEMHFEVNQGNRLIGMSINLNDKEVSLGDKPDIMALTANAKVSVNNPLMPMSAKLTLTFEATPWYDKSSKSIYLRGLNMTKVSAEPEEIENALKQISPQLINFVSSFLQTQPVYTLDERDSNQALMAKFAEEIKVETGKIVIKF
ncbi:DUF1439 domain-containing protein [Shewanella sp. WXL01]|uniref:DUF1439 domain-containing protein n=1 Tax=Shewanella sp. WXL01 TaxID=2709721 RepID=UPI0014383A09|nr:DUF1439 domain-containing protein [Shewanella sp. WXL01]NKF51982.1 DUF1439 domain-containing protein [Shewanella sp. WXL01]